MPRPDISSNRRGQRRTNTPFSHVRRTAPYHVHWRTIKTHEATYKAGKRGKGKQTVHVKTIGKSPPPEFRDFQLSGNTLKTFKRVSLKTTIRKAIVIMATKTKDKKTEKTAKKSRKKGPAEEDSEAGSVDEELDGLEELTEDEEESTDDESSEESTDDDDESADDDDGDDEDVEKPKSSKKDKKNKKKTTRAKANGKVGTQEIAAEAGCDARTLRMVLRKHEVEKDPESNRYEWDSMENSTVKKILKWIKEGEAKAVKKEGLDKLKKKKEEEKEAEGKKGKKGKKKSKKKKEEDDDDD